jgi:ribonucleotide reductase beta subunit family protein with ferritin-like domain
MKSTICCPVDPMPTSNILECTDDRLLLLPVKDHDAWKFYKDAIGAFWTAEEIDLAHDDFDAIGGADRQALKSVLAFFACADGIVGENLAVNLIPMVQSAECRAFYAFQAAIETVHQEVYGKIIETYIKDSEEQEQMFNAMRCDPAVSLLSDWALQWTDDASASFAERLVAFACVEGILFSGPFCIIFYYKTRGLLPGLCKSNEFIARDEAQHMMFACFLYKDRLLPEQKASVETVHRIITECVDLEKRFVERAIEGMPGLTAATMKRYIEFVADVLCVSLGVPRIYGVDNPFSWMTAIGMPAKTNFFEGRVSDYKRGVSPHVSDDAAFASEDLDF